ncbi:MAG: hypothetical protein R3E31_07170 [Chloroflexota bacterium]
MPISSLMMFAAMVNLRCGGCPGAAPLAAAEQVVVDHMDLLDAGHPTGIATINYSISGGNNPYYDAVELAFLAATDAGVFVSASAGNSGSHGCRYRCSFSMGRHNCCKYNTPTSANNLTDMTSDGAALADITGKALLLDMLPGFHRLCG